MVPLRATPLNLLLGLFGATDGGFGSHLALGSFRHVPKPHDERSALLWYAKFQRSWS